MQIETGANRVFGHSYGGLVALESAKRTDAFTELAVYEPGVSVGKSIRTTWSTRYEQLLANGATRGAFALFVQSSGHTPRPVTRLPLWYLKLIMRFVVRKRQWRRMEPLLQTNLVKHQQQVSLDDPLPSYAAITSRVLLLGGSKSPPFATRTLHALNQVVPHSTVEILAGLNHTAPDGQAPESVANCVLGFISQDLPEPGRQR